MTDRRRTRRKAWGDRTLVSHARVLSSRKGYRATVVSAVDPAIPGVSFFHRFDLVPLAPGWRIDGDTELRTLDDVLTWIAGYGLGAIEVRAERWKDVLG